MLTRRSKNMALLAIFLISFFVIPISLTMLTAEPAAAGTISINQLLQEPPSKPGGLTITWYDAKRSDTGLMPLFSGLRDLVDPDNPYGIVDEYNSKTAFRQQDRSRVVGTDTINDLNFDMTKWVFVGDDSAAAGTRDLFIWGEVTGYLKIPEGGNITIEPTLSSLYGPANCELEIDGNIVFSNWTSQPGNEAAYNSSIKPIQNSGGEYRPFVFRIGCALKDTKRDFTYNNNFGLNYGYRYTYGWVGLHAYLSTNNLYAQLNLKDMQPFFTFDTNNFTLTLDPMHSTFPVDKYEFGLCAPNEASTATGFQPLKLGTNYLLRNSGAVVVRDDFAHVNYITIANVTLGTINNLAVTMRTPQTATLNWSAPIGPDIPVRYEVYRKVVDGIPGFTPLGTILVAEPQLVGSSTTPTFTDKDLTYNYIYEYSVKVIYPTGSAQSNVVRTDSVALWGYPETPLNLNAAFTNQQAAKTDLTLNWQATQAEAGIKEYIVSRKLTLAPPPEGSNTGNVIILVGDGLQREIGRTTDTSYTDRDLNYGDQGEYYVQAVDNNGIPSVYSAPVKILMKDVTPPTRPEELRAREVLGQGDNVQYSQPEDAGLRNVILGPDRQIALDWLPSTDNVEMTGYKIYRSASGADYSTDGVFWGEPEHLIGTTQDTFFVDSGLEFGATYNYYVESADPAGNTNRNWVCIGTEKSSLAGLTIKNGTQVMMADPAFAYYIPEYTLNVANTVKSITLIPSKVDPQAKVMVNGVLSSGDSSIGPLLLDPGTNVITIDVIPRQGLRWFVQPETTRYTLTVNRANLAKLPVLTVPGNAAVLNEGDTYHALGRISTLDKVVWTGTADYGDGTGAKPLQLAADGSFTLDHKYVDNGQYTVNVDFRYKDLGLVSGSVAVTVQNVAPGLAGEGVKSEITIQEGTPLTIAGSIIDPGQDTWTIAGDYGSSWGPTKGIVYQDKTFVLEDVFYDQKPVCDMVLTISDDDGGSIARSIKINVQNAIPAVEAGGAGMAVRGEACTRQGSFIDPGLDTWQATVDYGETSGSQSLPLNSDKTFNLTHTYMRTGTYTVSIQVQDQDGGIGSASFPIKVKDYMFTFDATPDATLQEGQTLTGTMRAQGWPDKVRSITVDYGDGTGEQASTWMYHPEPSTVGNDLRAVVADSGHLTTGGRETGWIPLRHLYKDNGTYAVKAKIVDVDGDICEGSLNAVVTNVAPTVELEPIADMSEGTTFNGHGRITDPGDDTWTVQVYYQDGSSPDKVSVDADNTFSFTHKYSTSSYYQVQAVAQDEDGGVGADIESVNVISPSSGGGADPHDATIHSLRLLDPHFVLTPAFSRACTEYSVTPSGMYMCPVVVTVGAGATVKCTNGGIYNGDELTLDPVTHSASFTADFLGNLVLEVTAQDGVTIQTYTVESLTP